VRERYIASLILQMESSDNRVIANSVYNLMRRLPPLQVAKSL
jgi:hypothetical protein